MEEGETKGGESEWEGRRGGLHGISLKVLKKVAHTVAGGGKTEE